MWILQKVGTGDPQSNFATFARRWCPTIKVKLNVLRLNHVSRILENWCAPTQVPPLDSYVKRSINRIQRIEWQPCGLQKKALFIQTSVWPLALYSSDTICIGQEHFEKLRSAAANTLAGHWHNASPILACNFLSKFLKDPFVYTLCQCARILRRLSTVQHETAKGTIQFACDFEGSRPFGPASTLKHYFKQVGWSLGEDGTVTGPDHWSCNLLHDSTKRIVNILQCMWSHHIIYNQRTERELVNTCLIFEQLHVYSQNSMMKPNSWSNWTVWEDSMHRVWKPNGIVKWMTNANFVDKLTHENTVCLIAPLQLTYEVNMNMLQKFCMMKELNGCIFQHLDNMTCRCFCVRTSSCSSHQSFHLQCNMWRASYSFPLMVVHWTQRVPQQDWLHGLLCRILLTVIRNADLMRPFCSYLVPNFHPLKFWLWGWCIVTRQLQEANFLHF